MKNADFDALHGVETGKHLYQFYKSQEDYLRILTSYFAAGLEKGDACVWLVSEKTGMQRVLEYVRERIPDFDAHHQAGRMQILSAENWYLDKGSFNEEKSLYNAVQMGNRVRGLGCSRLRGAGDAAAIPHEQWAAVHQYEEKIHTALKSVPCVLLCAYPILDCSISDTRAVLKNHDSVLVGRLE